MPPMFTGQVPQKMTTPGTPRETGTGEMCRAKATGRASTTTTPCRSMTMCGLAVSLSMTASRPFSKAEGPLPPLTARSQAARGRSSTFPSYSQKVSTQLRPHRMPTDRPLSSTAVFPAETPFIPGETRTMAFVSLTALSPCPSSP